MTSLVLVDEAGAIQTGQPATRKVALPTPRTSVRRAARARFCAAPGAADPYSREVPFPSWNDEEEGSEPPRKRVQPALTYKPHNEVDLATIAARIRWSKLGDDAVMNLARLDRSKRAKIEIAAELPLVHKVSVELGVTPVALVLGLLARFMAGRDRHAARLAQALLGGVRSGVLVRLAELLELVRPA